MTEKKSKKKAGQKLLEAMAAFIGVEINAELTLQDSNGTDVVFPDIVEGDAPKVGDIATIDGSAIQDGSYIMPSLEEATVVFVDGKVSEIIPKEEEEVAEEVVEASKKPTEKKTEINAEEVSQISVWTMNVLNTTFEMGDKVTREGWEEGTEESVGSGEFMIPDGRRVVTDASGVIVLIKDAETAQEEVPVDAEASFEELLEKVTNKVKGNLETEYEASLLEKENEIKALKTKIGSKEFQASEKELENAKEEKPNYQASVLLKRKKSQ